MSEAVIIVMAEKSSERRTEKMLICKRAYKGISLFLEKMP